jgi:hypothetical protein
MRPLSLIEASEAKRNKKWLRSQYPFKDMHPMT